MSVAIRINNVEASVTSCSFVGFDAGIECDGDSLNLKDVYFGTRVGVKGKKVGSIKMNNVTHNESAWVMRLSPIAAVVRKTIYGAY
ncbi:hypothetical protein CJU72_12255 [Pseudomonas fragi]|nr:hypothetical protein CJU72_12255 [Pseudomonas fragi]